MSFKKPSVKPNIDAELERKIDEFGKRAPIKSADNSPTPEPAPENKPTKGFTVPLSEAELEMLRALQQHEERSMRVIARRIFTRALQKEFDSITEE